MDKPRLDQGSDYERGFIDGMMYQTQTSVDKAVNRMAQQEPNKDVEQSTDDPVAWMVYTKDGMSVYVTDNPADILEGQAALPLFTSPPQRKPLTKERIRQIVAENVEGVTVAESVYFYTVARAIEAAHGIKE